MAKATEKIKETTFKNTKLNTVKLDWKEVYYTNCPLVSASNVDEGLGLTKKEFKKIGVKFAYMRSTPRNRLVSPLHPQSGKSHPLRRLVSAYPSARRYPPDQTSWGDSDAGRRRCHDGARQGRHLPDE